MKFFMVCCFVALITGIVGAQPVPIGEPVSVPVDTVGDQQEPTIAVNKDGVVFVCYEVPGKITPGNRDLVAVISSDFVNWKEVEIVSRDSVDEDPKAAADPLTGNFGVTWYQDDDPGADMGADGDGMGEFFRIIKADGTPVTDVISVSDDYSPRGAGGQGWGSCAFNPANGYLYVINEDWGEGSANVPSPDGDGDAQVLRIFDGQTGKQVGDKILVNTDGAGNQDDGFIAFANDGSFAATWREYGGDDRIWSQRFDKDLNKVGPEVDVSVDSEVAFFVQNPHISSSADGHYIIIFTETFDEADGSGRGMFFNIYNPDGTLFLKDGQANENFDGNQEDGEVAMDDTGRFVIGWEDNTIDGDGKAAMVRAFNADGTPAGPDLMVNVDTNGTQEDVTVGIVSPEVAAKVGFDFVVAYEDSGGNDGDGKGIFVRRYRFGPTPVMEWSLY